MLQSYHAIWQSWTTCLLRFLSLLHWAAEVPLFIRKLSNRNCLPRVFSNIYFCIWIMHACPALLLASSLFFFLNVALSLWLMIWLLSDTIEAIHLCVANVMVNLWTLVFLDTYLSWDDNTQRPYFEKTKLEAGILRHTIEFHITW